MDNQDYEERAFLGTSLDHVVEELLNFHASGRRVKTQFNTVTLYSDTVTMDDAYIAVTGFTKHEVDKARAEQHANYLAQEAAHLLKIPELTEEWITKGHAVLAESKWTMWDHIVPIRLKDLYHGMELEQCVLLVKMLDHDQCPFEEADKQMQDQGHSGMSWSLVKAMVKEFAVRGEEFAGYLDNRY